MRRGRPLTRRYSMRRPTAVANRSMVEVRASTSPDSSRATAGWDVPILAATASCNSPSASRRRTSRRSSFRRSRAASTRRGKSGFFLAPAVLSSSRKSGRRRGAFVTWVTIPRSIWPIALSRSARVAHLAREGRMAPARRHLVEPFAMACNHVSSRASCGAISRIAGDMT